MASIDDEISDLKIDKLLQDPAGLSRVLHRGFSYVVELVDRHQEALAAHIPEFRRHFVAPLKSIKDVQWTTLDDGSAFNFNFASGLVQINIGHVSGLMMAVHDRVQFGRSLPNSQETLAVEEETKLVRLILFLFLLHEVRHISQGLGRYQDVQLIKNRLGSLLLGDLDLLADRDAARAYAMMEIIDENTIDAQNYIHAFARALFFMVEFCFPAFKAPIEKPHKVARALGLLLMLSRIAVAIKDNSIDSFRKEGIPLDSALVVRIAPDWSTITVLAFTPELQLAAIEHPIDAVWLRTLCEELDSGDADSLVEKGVKLLKILRMA